jgi:hypothetical protein
MITELNPDHGAEYGSRPLRRGPRRLLCMPGQHCGQICNRCEPRLPTVPVEGPTWVLDVTKDHG